MDASASYVTGCEHAKRHNHAVKASEAISDVAHV